MTERLHFHFSLACTGEGDGNPLQCSCLENPRDGGAWWAAVYGVAQSWTQLTWLSSSSSHPEPASWSLQLPLFQWHQHGPIISSSLLTSATPLWWCFWMCLTFHLQSLLGPTQAFSVFSWSLQPSPNLPFLISFSSLVSLPDTEQTYLSKVHLWGGDTHFQYILQFFPALHCLCPTDSSSSSPYVPLHSPVPAMCCSLSILAPLPQISSIPSPQSFKISLNLALSQASLLGSLAV